MMGRFIYTTYIYVTRNWNLYRAVQLFLGAVFLINGLTAPDPAIGAIGVLFILLSLSKAGCAGRNCLMD